MTSKEQTELREEQIHSLKWAIEELEKEKETIGQRLEKTRQENGLRTSLDDALSEQELINDRVSTLEDTLKDFDDTGKETPASDNLKSQKDSLDERIVIASERLAVMEQDRELEHIALRFKGEQLASDTEIKSASTDSLSQNSQSTEQSMEEATTDNRLQNMGSSKEPNIESVAQLSEVEAKPKVTSGSLVCQEATNETLRDAATALDLDPEYLLDKSVQAVLRMIQRNKNRVTFPLEVKQIDSID